MEWSKKWYPGCNFYNNFGKCAFWTTWYLCMLVIFCCVEVITQERTIHNIEVFDKTKLKHAETAEKVVLPDEKGRFLCG